MLKATIANEFNRHSELAESSLCSATDKRYFDSAVNLTLDEVGLSRAFEVLSRMLYQHHKEKAILIIDEYDVPIQQGYTRDFYDKVIEFMRNLFSGGLKDNGSLAYGFLTGILRVAKESIFSGMNNLKTYSILDKKFSTSFGFTSDEIREMAKYYHAEDKYEELCDWYDGYRFGNSDIFNPWSVINYFSDNCDPRAYWQSTGSNDIIGEIAQEAGSDTIEKLKKLLNGEQFLTYVDTAVIYPEIKKNPSTIFSFLLVAGYLKIVKAGRSKVGDDMCTVALPNKEIRYVYNKEVLRKFDKMILPSTAIMLQEAMFQNDTETMQQQLKNLLLQSVSYFDTTKEIFYHGLMLGLCAIFNDRYLLRSNREAGLGRYDIQLEPKTSALPGFIIELKAAKAATQSELQTLSQQALSQIINNQYDRDLRERDVQPIFRYGVAFSGKDVKISAD